MSHLIRTEKRFEATPSEWLPFGSQVAEQCNIWAGRGDIISYVGKGAGGGRAVACFVPKIAEMELNVEEAFGEGITPEWVGDFTDRNTHFDHPQIAGVVLHEAMHARHTLYPLDRWDEITKEHGSFVQRVVECFEETRIERLGVMHFPENRSFLRASALKLSIGELEADEDFASRGIESFSTLMLLSLARVDAGILEPEDVEPIQAAAVKLLGEKLLGELRSIWWKAQRHRDDTTCEPLLELAIEWVEKLKEAGFEPPPPLEILVVAGAPGSESGADADAGSSVIISPGTLKDLLDEMGEKSEEVEIEARGEAAGQALDEADQRAAQAAKELAQESKSSADQASKVFGRGTGDARGSTRSILVEERSPTGPEKVAAVRIAKALDKAKYRDRVVTTVTSQLPPGKLNGRAAVQARVERSRGQLVTAEPWRAKRRHSVEDPKLKLGLMTDVSGSMSSAMEPMAVTAWLMSEAGRRVQAEVASVYYGNSVFAGLAPGQHLEKIKIYSAGDMTERFDNAFKALNGALHLLDGTGARLLVIASDMYYTAHEVDALKKWLCRCNQTGVAVVSIPFTTTRYVKENTEGIDLQLVQGAMKPVQVAELIGKACADALTKAGARA